jgi:hypothetical protein
MSQAVKLGPLWNRTVFSPDARAVKRMGRTLCRFDEVRQLRLTEFFAAYEEEQLLNVHPDVEKSQREAELWADLKDGRAALLGTLESGGLLLASASAAAKLIGVPLVSERKHLTPVAA